MEEIKKPNDLIPEQKMVEILTDLSLLNSAKNYNKRQLEETGLQPEEFLYEKHNIDSLRLAESTKYYAKHPATFEKIYNRVRNNIEALKRDLEVIQEEEIRIRDSINAAENGDTIRTPRPIIRGRLDDDDMDRIP